MILTDKQQGILVISTLNKLPFLGDYLNPDLPGEGCCPRCCAPCHVLWELDQHGHLDDAIMFAPSFMYADVAWWRSSRVDRIWLNSLWASQDEHITGDEGGHDNAESLVDRLTDHFETTRGEALLLIESRLHYEDTLTAQPVNRVDTPL